MSATTRSTKRRGFALPLAILALALVTAAVAASVAAQRAEIVANQAARAQDRAYQMAEAGLELFTARRSDAGFCTNCQADPSISAVDSEWTRVSLIGGYADVVAMRIRAKLSDTLPALFFIRSRGVDTTAKLSGNSLTVYAERTIGQYATFRTAGIKPVASFVSLTGLTKTNNGTLDGTDVCFGGGAPSIAGVAVPTGELAGTSTNVNNPNTSLSFNALAARLGVDWNAIVNNYAIPADDTDVWPGNVWRITRITSPSYTIPSDGKGILIALGDVTMNGSRDYDGIMLVGGNIYAGGSQASTGTAISGLNYTLPGATPPVAGSANNSTMSGNSKQFLYSSCSISSAINLLSKYYAVSNAWLDNVAVW